MSLILDALSRAERERRRAQDPTPDLLAEHGPPVPARAPSRLGPLFFAVVVLTVMAVALWLTLRGDPGETDKPAARGLVEQQPAAAGASRPRGPDGQELMREIGAADAGSAAPQTQAAGVPPAAPAQPRAVMQTPEPAADRDAIARLYERADVSAADEAGDTSGSGNSGADSAISEDAARDDGGNAVVVDSAAAIAGPQSVPEPDPGAEDGTRSAEPIDLEQVLRQARAETAASGLSPHPVPLLQTLTKQYRDSVPTLMYLRHDYFPSAASTVLLNGDSLRVGGQTRGVEVLEILADSVILRYGDRDFRLRALNSWVNL